MGKYCFEFSVNRAVRKKFKKSKEIKEEESIKEDHIKASSEFIWEISPITPTHNYYTRFGNFLTPLSDLI